MKRTIKSIAAISTLSALAIAPILLSANAVVANPLSRGTNASYIGGGFSVGVTDGSNNDDSDSLGVNIQGRYAVPVAPISIRGAVLAGDDTSAIMPLLSYDIPVTNNANVYIGGGYSFVEQDGQGTTLGNQDAPVAVVGAEAQIGQHLVVYGDTKVGFDAYENSNSTAVSLQLGAGYRF